MSRMRWIFAAFIAATLSLVLAQGVHASFVQTQRDQISVFVLVNVTPAPLTGSVQHASPAKPQIAMNMRLRARGSGDADAVPNFNIGGNPIAQAQNAVRVQAEVSPNPNATLLYSNSPDVTINATAGTTVTTPACVYTVTVHTLSTTSWTLDDGVSNDFTATFPGKNLANNTYIQTANPNPTTTPFVVYPHNNNTWFAFAKSSGVQTYCVTLTLTVPATVKEGAYSTNAIYTLYY
jgi:hypothetical protein